MKDKKSINIEIGARIKNAREAAELTQERFAELVELGPKNVSAIECGAVGVSIASLRRICEVLNISSDTLLFDPAEEISEATLLADRLTRLSPEQFAIVKAVFNKLMEAFALKK